jgi:hypothetical protein
LRWNHCRPATPSDAEAFRILFGGVVVVCGDLLMGLWPMASEGDRSGPDLGSN